MKKERLLTIIFFVSWICSLNIGAQEVKEKRITMEFKNERMSSAFKSLERVSGYKILFAYEDVSQYFVDGKVKNQTIEQVLKFMIGNKPLKYLVDGQFVNITPQKKATVGIFERVKGTVVSAEDGMPIIGASVQVVGTSIGAQTNLDGKFELAQVPDDAIIRISYIGMETASESAKTIMNVRLKVDVQALDDVVVTGYYTQRKQTFTGAATNYSGAELSAISNQSVLTTIAAVDPSFKIVDNLAMGSDPNTVPNIQIRGVNALPTTTNLSEEYKGNSNLPTFILDGFEVSVEKIYDLDPNRVSNISILKDASATAIYGSRASNGVVIIDTKAPASGKLRLNYYGSMDFEVADLSDYHLLHASDKLEYERLAGLYVGTGAVYVDEEYRRSYNERLKLVQKGYDTDWLAQPLRSLGISHRHSVQLEGGNESFRYGVDLTYNGTSGVMKGSDRKRIGTGIKLQYNYRNLRFRNEITYDKVTSNNSPYGSFGDYANMNPYYYPYDENGQLKKILFTIYSPSAGSTTVVNPMYNATLNTKDCTTYDDFVDNFSVEWNILSNLKLKGNFSLERINKSTDIFKPADHTDFATVQENQGSYTKGNTVSSSYDGSLVLSYFGQFKKHALSLNGGWNIQQTSNDYSTYTVNGFPNQQLDHPAMGAGFLDGSIVRGDATMTRLMGFFGNANYSFDDRYFVDASIRMDGSSMFGSNQRWGTFWSTGIGWNLHNEAFVKNIDFVEQFRLRMSTGYTGSQSFYPYQSLMMYQYRSSLAYQNYIGTVIKAFGNSDLKWQRTHKTNFGIDFGFFDNRLSGYFNYFIENSKDLLVDVNMASYLGFDSYKENLGETQNKGYDFNVKLTAFQNKDWRVNLFVNGQHYNNTLRKISSGLSSFNEKADAESSTKTYVRYVEGASINTIWVVPSAGIDPATGNEVFISKDGSYTSTWSEKDYVPYASADPKLSGTFGFNVYYKGFELNTNFYYRFGGYAYNQTLVDKVENVNPYNNVDERALYNRWQTPGVAAEYKRISDRSATKPTSRFVEKDNFLSANSISLAYTFKKDWIRHFGAQYLKLALTANDFMRMSTIRREIGTTYPYAHHYSFTAQLTF